MERAKSDMNLSQLTDEERHSILRVLKRDQALRTMEEKRLQYLKSELHILKKRGALKPGLDGGSRCARCLTPLGLLLNSGADCFICLKKVCRSCRQSNEHAPSNSNIKQWACLVCSKQMELKAATGEWMEEYKPNKSKQEERTLKNYELVRELAKPDNFKSNEKRQASLLDQPRFSPNISIRSAPASCSKTDSPKFERRVQFLSGSQEISQKTKKVPGNMKLASPPALKKSPLLCNSKLDLANNSDPSESLHLSKSAKVHPEARKIDEKERLPISPIFYNKCRSRKDSSSSVSTCSLSSSSIQGPSPIALRKNIHESPLDVELRNKRIKEETKGNKFQSWAMPKNCPERSISEPCYEINDTPRALEAQYIKSYSLSSYEESHSPKVLESKLKNLTLGSAENTLGSAENISDTTTSNTPSEYSRPTSISPATFRRVLVSSFNDSSSSHSESEIEPTQPQNVRFRKVSLKKNSLISAGKL